MAYSSTNPPANLVATVGDGQALWLYNSTHTVAEAAASGFFSNGDALGMVAGHPVLVVEGTAYKTILCYVTSVTASSAASISAVTTTTG